MAGLFVPETFPSSLRRLQTSMLPGGVLPRAASRHECFRRSEEQYALRSPLAGAPRPAASSPRTLAVERIASRISFQILRFNSKESRDDGRCPLPVAGLGAELFAPGARQPIEASLAVVLGGAPFRGDGTFLLEFQQDRIHGPLIDAEKISADLLDPPGNPVAVQGSENIQRLEHHERQCTLLNVRFLHFSVGFPQKRKTHLIWENNRVHMEED